MKTVGLDIATKVGVCLGEPGQTPTFWTEDLGYALPHEERGAKLLRFTHRLIRDHDVSAIGIEAPIRKKHDKKSTNELLMGLIFVVRSWAAMKGIPCRTFEVSTIDKNFLGAAQKGGRDERKRAIRKQCEMFGWNPQTDDEADAGAVFWMACAMQSRSFGIHHSPLFFGKGA